MLVVQFRCADHGDEEALNSINIISQIIIPNRSKHEYLISLNGDKGDRLLY